MCTTQRVEDHHFIGYGLMNSGFESYGLHTNTSFHVRNSPAFLQINQVRDHNPTMIIRRPFLPTRSQTISSQCLGNLQMRRYQQDDWNAVASLLTTCRHIPFFIELLFLRPHLRILSFLSV